MPDGREKIILSGLREIKTQLYYDVVPGEPAIVCGVCAEAIMYFAYQSLNLCHPPCSHHRTCISIDINRTSAPVHLYKVVNRPDNMNSIVLVECHHR